MAAPSALQFYANNLDIEKLSDLSANVFMLLTSSTYVPDTSNTGHTILANITNEVAAGNGYSTGGVALSAPAVAAYLTTGFKFSTGNAAWTASGAGIPAWRYGVIYYSGVLWGVTSPLIGYFTGDSAPADIPLTAAGNILQVNCPTNGWLTKTRT
jgi:hypothetical protein